MSVTDLIVERVASPAREPWVAFVSGRDDAEIAHLWSFQQLLEQTFGLRVIRLAARRGDEWAGVLPLALQQSVLGRFLTSLPYLNHAGVLGSDPAARAALAGEALRIARELGVDRLELRGRCGDDLPLETWSGKCGYELELPSLADELWGNFGSKLRAQIRRPRKAGYETRVSGAGGHRSFYPLLARRWHQLGSPTLPEAFFVNLESCSGTEVEYAFVQRDGEPVAAALLVSKGTRVEVPWAAAAVEHNRYGVNMLLYWTALERAVERGARVFDFGRSTPGGGTARFKLQWGAGEHPLQWSVFVRSNRGRSTEQGGVRRGLAARVWRRIPAKIAGRVGPLLAARIPL